MTDKNATALTSAEKLDEQDYPCANCGAKLHFGVAKAALECPYCGHETGIPRSEEDIKEIDYQGRLRALAAAAQTVEQSHVKCESCAATVEVPEGQVSFECPYCGTPIVVQPTSESVIKPRSLLPFAVTREQGREAYRKWLNSLWFAPGFLKTRAFMNEKLRGMYVPYWTYDSNTFAFYRGERGDNYSVRKTRTVTRDGKQVTEEYTATEVRWRPVSGHVYCSFDDVLVMASKSLPTGIADRLEPWDLENLAPYQNDYLAGFTCERYQLDVAQGFEVARGKMDRRIRRLIRHDIGGDQQRIHSVRAQHDNVTFKHILLPIWICAYRYHDKVYRFLINARTGEVQGERPWSWLKIAAAAAAALIVAAALAWFTK